MRCDALVVGGGPAGSTCARALHRAGWHVIVADCARFPREKVCAGWLTPGVFEALDLDPAEYRAAGLTLQDITAFRTGLAGGRLIETRYPHVVSYAIRRCEFDDFLLRRTGACVLEGTPVLRLRRARGEWIVNEAIRTPLLVGAGGHFCPVARHLRGGADLVRPVVAKEVELKLERGRNPDEAPALYFCRDLKGYGWCVRKGEYLNVGLGRRETHGFPAHLRRFVASIGAGDLLPPLSDGRWRGHAYLCSGTGTRPLTAPGALLVGDAAGLAYPESGEGIGPAIESGRLAAETLIAAGSGMDVDALEPYADAMRRRHPSAAGASLVPRPLVRTAGRLLLRSHTFTRHVVLDRWFLRRA
jgi:flavin-dependent dehydrogenase